MENYKCIAYPPENICYHFKVVNTYYIHIVSTSMQYLWIFIDIFKFLAIIALISWQKGFNYLWLNMITVDSLFSSADVFIDTICPRQKMLNRYDIVDRYIYYTAVGLGAAGVNIATWWLFNDYLYWITIISACPALMNILLATQVFAAVRQTVVRPVIQLSGYLLCSCVAYIINTMALTIIQINPEVSHKEIIRFISKDNLAGFVNLVKSFAVAILGNYLETKSVYYMWALNVFCKFGLVPAKISAQVANMQSRDKLRHIILYRQWELFCNPEILRCGIELYLASDKGKMMARIRSGVIQIQDHTVRFFAIYSIGSVAPPAQEWLYLTCSAVILLALRCFYDRGVPSKWQVMVRAAATGLAYYHGGIVGEALILEYADLLDNKLLRWVVNKIIVLAHNKIKILRRGTYKLPLIARCIILCLIFRNMIAGQYVVFLLLGVYLMPQTPVLLLLFIIMGIFSNYAAAHLLFIGTGSYIYYVAINIAPAPQLRPIMIDDYNEDSRAGVRRVSSAETISIDATDSLMQSDWTLISS